MELRKISELEREEIEEYLFLDEDELYSLIPSYFDKYKGTFFSPDGQKKAGIKEFQALRGVIYDKLCQEWGLCNKIDDPVLADNINLVTAIADIISPFLIGFPPFVIASILVKIGIRKFCNCSIIS